jgi:hypothetical protein
VLRFSTKPMSEPTSMAAECRITTGLCPDVVEHRVRIEEHRVRIEGLDRASARIEGRIDALLYLALGSLLASCGTLLLIVLKKG